MNLRKVSEDTKAQLNKKHKTTKRHRNIFTTMRGMCDHDWDELEDQPGVYKCKHCKDEVSLA